MIEGLGVENQCLSLLFICEKFIKSSCNPHYFVLMIVETGAPLEPGAGRYHERTMGSTLFKKGEDMSAAGMSLDQASTGTTDLRKRSVAASQL
jgi:hypothetical protein